MSNPSRILGGLGLVLCVAAAVAACLLAARIDRIAGLLLDRATQVLDDAATRAEGVAERVLDLSHLGDVLAEGFGQPAKAADSPSNERVLAVLERLRTLEQMLAALSGKVESVQILLDAAGDLGLGVTGDRLQEVEERLGGLESKVALAADRINELASGFDPGRSLTEAAARRVFAEIDAVVSPAGNVVAAIEQATRESENRLARIRARVRSLAVAGALTATFLAGWMGLGQAALLRHGMANRRTSL